MGKEDIRDFFREYYSTHKDAIQKNMRATATDRLESLRESIDTKTELR